MELFSILKSIFFIRMYFTASYLLFDDRYGGYWTTVVLWLFVKIALSYEKVPDPCSECQFRQGRRMTSKILLKFISRLIMWFYGRNTRVVFFSQTKISNQIQRAVKNRPIWASLYVRVDHSMANNTSNRWLEMIRGAGKVGTRTDRYTSNADPFELN